MNRKITSWIVAAAIVYLAGWLAMKSNLSNEQRALLASCSLFAAIACGQLAIRKARITVLARRLLLIDHWRSPDPSSPGGSAEVVELVGRINAARTVRMVWIAGCAAAFYFGAPDWALVLCLGELFLSYRLVSVAQTLARRVPSDAKRRRLSPTLPDSPSGRYLVVVNMDAVRDSLQAAAPAIWTPFLGPFNWLTMCGLRFFGDNRWMGYRPSIELLDSNEIVSAAVSK